MGRWEGLLKSTGHLAGGGDGNILKLHTNNECINSVNIQEMGEFYVTLVVSQ